MFAEEDWEQIICKINGMDGSCLEVIMRTPYGPTAVERHFKKGLRNRGLYVAKTINWWSGASSFGVLEIELEKGGKIYAVWSRGSDNELLKVVPRKKMDMQYLLDSMASSNVAPGVMRTFSHARFPGG